MRRVVEESRAFVYSLINDVSVIRLIGVKIKKSAQTRGYMQGQDVKISIVFAIRWLQDFSFIPPMIFKQTFLSLSKLYFLSAEFFMLTLVFGLYFNGPFRQLDVSFNGYSQ